MKSIFRTLTVASAMVLSAHAMAADNSQSDQKDQKPPMMQRGPGGPGPHMHGPMMGPGPMMPFPMLLKGPMAKELGLSEAQTGKIKALLDADHKQHEAEMKAKQAEFKALMDAPKFDEAKAKALLADRKDMGLDRLRLAHDVMQVLTPAQRDKLAKMRDHHPERGHMKKPPRPGKDD
ncbi:Spy/CpxP family protein refolding chaperone [Gallaecimonas mangrovi]|uniref:Spy/CpxP family protein refolding chaperone n=1 Tax=Gallaecimonas mangrovi TaxID=2291597 RepID=UPI000E20486B|nr:Spy/CpxP family protein refolding chaperone [Gallaecimonas mangrovi]